ncbi:uncharacterized protein LOC100904396 [Galendromus occidentalis]|uniref:Uncharacterized protein LOC100904396 n=1 Tax=Galendromus occidentalis TaxID=34638 RepID=A0AAJ7PB17_9ACAR|nr:uncharacterized protein LOC100904396 [Galendromus occidentalis]
MAQVGVGKSVGGGDQHVTEELKPLSIPVVPQSLQRTQREDLYYGQQPQNGRGVSMTSPANSLGTESLVTPNTTPEPSGSPRTLDQEPLVLPPPSISTPYDRYMQAPSMNAPPYMAYPIYSQPAVYLVHPHMSYMPHPMEPMHVSYDMSVPPPNLGYMPMGPHLFSGSMCKLSNPQERYYSYEQTPPPMTASPVGGVAPHLPQVPQSTEISMTGTQGPETPSSDFTATDQLFPRSVDDRQLDGDSTLQPTYGSAEDEVAEITELIDEVQIFDADTTPSTETLNNVDRWYETMTEQHHAATDDNKNPESGESEVQRISCIQQPAAGSGLSQPPEINNNAPHDRRPRATYHAQRGNQRYPSVSQRDRNFRESSNGRYDHDRRSETPDKRNRTGNPNYRGPPRDDRRFSNPEYGSPDQYRSKRSREFRGDFENQGPASRENSAVRRGDNRQRYYTSPRRDEELNRYDGNVRRSGSYRNRWRDDFNGNRNEEPPKSVPRSRPERDRTDSAQRNSRRPPVAARQNEGQRGHGKNASRPRASDEDSLEFLLPSTVGVKDPLDMKSMISDRAVSMDCIASQKAPHPSSRDQIPGPAAGRKANRRVE